MPSSCPFHDFSTIKEFDALDRIARQNPWPYYDWLRSASESVYKVPHEEGFYMVHRYEDVKSILSDPENFSNKIIPTVKSPFLALMDGAEHVRIREVVTEIFSPKNLVTIEPAIRSAVSSITNQLFQNRPVELFDTWANIIPLSALSLVFGLDTSSSAILKLHHDSIAINKALFVTGGTGPRRSNRPDLVEKLNISWALLKNSGKILRLGSVLGKKGMSELLEMIRPVNHNLIVPRPNFEHIPGAIESLLDLMLTFANRSNKNHSKNIAGQVFENSVLKGRLSKTEMMMAGAFVLFAGYETTSSLLSNCFIRLANDPGLFRELKNNPEKIDDFTEECLRYYTPVGRFLRRAKKDMFISGILIPKDSVIILMTGAANTDPEKFYNGCSFDMNRNNNRQHLSFGKGSHFCVGAPLARMQVSMALKELIHKAHLLRNEDLAGLKMVTDRDNGIFRYEKIMVEVE